MQNQFNSQFLPNQAYVGQMPSAQPVYPMAAPQSSPTASVGAVNIQIFNPTANAPQQGFYQPTACSPYPYNYNNAFVPQQQVMPSTNPIQPQYNQDMNQTMNLNTNGQNAVASNSNAPEQPKEADKKAEEKDKKPTVPLTDDYIKTLENYLNSQDKKIRLMGAKELLERFREDETRKDDAALTALLNKTLQDPAETVKFVALTTLDAGYATGNDETAQILTQMQSSASSYGEDAALASQILLKMSGYKAMADAQNMQPQEQAMPAENQAVQATQDNMPIASMSQNMQVMPNGQATMNENITPSNSQAVM